jgi:hypothetical protein
MSDISRRRFVTGACTTGALATLGEFGFLGRLPTLSADDVKVKPSLVKLDPDIEPLVRLIEETPREKLLAVAADKVRDGTTYGQFLAAVMLAGVRGIRPRPVGYQFHAVLVINSAHLATLAARDQDRWLPMFWALDNFKVSQATNKQKNNGWTMPPLDDAKLPSAFAARQAFIDAMDNWDEEAADRAVAALIRTASSTDVLELLWRYGCRDFRDIGHKAIYVANASRLLNTIGWHHAEPVLRSITMALLEHEGGNPAKRDADPDRPFRENRKRSEAIGDRWQSGKLSPEATTDFLAALRAADASKACEEIVTLRKKGVHPQSVWDGLFLTAGELLMRQPGIVGIHCVTSINALYQAYQTTGSSDTRRMVMLQGAAFLAMFREAMGKRGKLGDVKLDELKADPPEGKMFSIDDVLADAGGKGAKGQDAARKAMVLLAAEPGKAKELMAAARRLLFAKGDNAHDYKFSSAALEDYYHVSPHWRPRYLASSMVQLRGSGERDNNLIQRTREALAKS